METDEEQITGLTGEPEGRSAEHPGQDAELSRISLLATLGILGVTILATLAATLAAISAYQENIANRNRQLWGSYSLALTVQEDTTWNGNQQAADAEDVAYWRAVFTQWFSTGTVVPPTRTDVQQARNAYVVAEGGARGQRPPEPAPGGVADRSECGGLSTSSPSVGQIGTQSDCAAQFAAAYGDTAEGFLRNEHTYLAIASALAIALFLFALSRTLLLPPMQWMFLVVATVIMAGGAAIGIYELAARSARQPDPGAITAYEHRDFARAVRLAPGYVAAWEQMGNSWASRGDTVESCARSVPDFAQAERLDPTTINENNLASDELSCGQLSPAGAALTAALRDRDIAVNPWPLGSTAEYYLVAGRTAKAEQTLRAAIRDMESVTGNDGTTHRGWIYQDEWFSSLLSDQNWLVRRAPRRTGVAFVHDVEAAQAALDAQEATGWAVSDRTTPDTSISDMALDPGPVCCSSTTTGAALPVPPTVSAAVSPPATPTADHLGSGRGTARLTAGSVVPSSPPITKMPAPTSPRVPPAPGALNPGAPRTPRGAPLETPVRVSFRYAGLQPGDVVSLIWYDKADSASDVAETFETVGDAGAPSPGTGTYTTPGWIFAPSGSYRLVAVMNSTFGAESQVSVPAEGG